MESPEFHAPKSPEDLRRVSGIYGHLQKFIFGEKKFLLSRGRVQLDSLISGNF